MRDVGDLLILLPETGRAGGKRKSTVVTITYEIPSCTMIQRMLFA